jgi:beta-barrel assembly-enhancing protease
VRVSYEDSSIVNAYATLGGRIRVHGALLRKLRSEDELAALLAHEIAHVRHRHVAAQLGSGLALALMLGVVSSDAGAAAAGSALGQVANVAMLGYSREQEEQADWEALKAVVAVYGHAEGMVALFGHLDEPASAADAPPQVLSTHPMTSARIDAIRSQARRAGWRLTGPLTPWPAALPLPGQGPPAPPAAR